MFQNFQVDPFPTRKRKKISVSVPFQTDTGSSVSFLEINVIYVLEMIPFYIKNIDIYITYFCIQ
jgi:hypothetical protein